MCVLQKINTKLRRIVAGVNRTIHKDIFQPIGLIIVGLFIQDYYKDCNKIIIIVSIGMSFVVYYAFKNMKNSEGLAFFLNLIILLFMFYPVIITDNKSKNLNKIGTPFTTELPPKQEPSLIIDPSPPMSEKPKMRQPQQQKSGEKTVAITSRPSLSTKIAQPKNTNITGPYGWKPEMPKDLYPSGHAGHPVLENRPGPYGY